jgi:hypothetical protein
MHNFFVCCGVVLMTCSSHLSWLSCILGKPPCHLSHTARRWWAPRLQQQPWSFHLASYSGAQPGIQPCHFLWQQQVTQWRSTYKQQDVNML